MENSGDFSDELDEFEESHEDVKKKVGTNVANKPYDEAYELSQDLSMAESYDGKAEQKKPQGEQKMKNDKYDEAVDVSQSMDQSNMAVKDIRSPTRVFDRDISGKSDSARRDSDLSSVSRGVINKPFDEALEFSHSESDDSVETKHSEKRGKAGGFEAKGVAPVSTPGGPNQKATPSAIPQQKSTPQPIPASSRQSKPTQGEDEESSDDDGEQGESYENIAGAYNPKDYLSLNVTAEVRDLFQYIERFKPQEVELESTLKCFIPEYIPAIGEMDAFIKVPRPDKKEEDLGLKFLDEPCGNQSDPTVLELQLRAMSKKLQYGDVVVRSIDNAAKNPVAIEKWIQSVQDLHRSKPPPQVHYKRNMPDIDSLLDVWPEEFEIALKTLKLPSPDLDLSLAEYSKTLCAILDIPTYENPIESLHQMFSLYMDFRNNPHLQARELTGREPGLGSADVMHVDQGY